jgi:TM2 domain-containing membrane protein YozV
MITCKHCGTPIDQTMEYCPICKQLNPSYQELDTSHKDYTDTYNPVEEQYVLIKQKKRKIAVILSLLLGFVGAPFYYLLHHRRGFLWLLVNGLLIAIIIALFINNWPYRTLLLIISFSLIGLLQLFLSLFIAIKNDLKDGRGELLK